MDTFEYNLQVEVEVLVVAKGIVDVDEHVQVGSSPAVLSLRFPERLGYYVA